MWEALTNYLCHRGFRRGPRTVNTGVARVEPRRRTVQTAAVSAPARGLERTSGECPPGYKFSQLYRRPGVGRSEILGVQFGERFLGGFDMKRSVASSATKQRALAREAEVGAAQAARELGLLAATVRGWKLRADKPAPRTAKQYETQGDRQQRGADRTWEVAEAALRKALVAIESGDTLAAQRLMVSAGIAADKTGQLEEASARAAERHVRLQASQGDVIVNVFRAVFTALGIPMTSAAGKAIGEALRGAKAGGVIVVSPEVAEAAAADVREALGRPELPARDDGPVIDGQLTVDDVIATEPELEPADAEVVEAPLPDAWLELSHGDPVAARRAFDRFKAEERDLERRERDRPDAWRTGLGDGGGNSITELYQEARGGPGVAI